MRPISPPARRATLIITVAALGFWTWERWTPPAESPIDLAYRLCGECGIEPGEVNAFIENLQHSTLTREQELDRFRELFKEPNQARECEPCAKTVLTAAGM